jgi:hypothetical protein
MYNCPRRDATLIATKALPAAGATAISDAIDLGGVDATLGRIEIELVVPALPNLAATKNAVFTLKDSADNVTFAAIGELAALTLTGVSTSGAAAATRAVRLPSSARRYLRFDVTVDAAGGDSTAKSATLSLLF